MLALMVMVLAAATAHADIRPLLRAQGFQEPLNGRESIKFAGQISQGADSYQVYTYHGVFRTAVVDHGMNRIIVVKNKRALVGSYPVSMPTDCKVQRQTVVCKFDDPGRSIRFTKDGPPHEIWLDGEVVQLVPGDQLTK